MDPVSAIGLASGIVTFVEAGFKLVKIAHDIHTSVDGTLNENKQRECVATEVHEAALRLTITGNDSMTPEQRSLSSLARMCQGTSTELVDILNQLKAKPRSSNVFKTSLYAIKAKKNAGQIRALEDRLKGYRDQLTLALVEVSRVEAADDFMKLLSLVKSNEAKLDSLTEAISHLRRTQFFQTGQQPPPFQHLLMIDKQARCAIYHDHILKSLEFEEMHARYEAVHNAHTVTFKWIYQPIDMAPKYYESPKAAERSQMILQMQLESQEKFIGWLTSKTPSSPIFHISGKLGSGKSTLMKYICSHPRTKQEPDKWAGSTKLVFASFFFWRNGTSKQRSLDGLCRSLLHDVLEQRPDLISSIFPMHRSMVEQGSWKTHDKLKIPETMIKDALQRLLQDKRLFDKHSFCIFIDGLDEFEPGVQDGTDYKDLVDILRQWAVQANGNLKLCVSSREESVFMDEYTSDPGFKLQDLTRFDMQNYVCSRLNDLKNQDLKDHFIRVIPERSSGIFLWTYLVVRRIRNKIANRVSDETLKEYLQTLPDGLKSLFQDVLQNLEPDDMAWTLRTIDLIQTAKSNGLELTLLASSFLKEYDEDAEFSVRDNLDGLVRDEDLLRAQLPGACGGLIESHKSFVTGYPDTLDYIHRSVPDMFHKSARTPVLSLQMEIAVKGTDTIDVLSHLTFASIRQLRDKIPPYRQEYICKKLAIMRLRNKTDKPPYDFLEYMGTCFKDRWLDDPQSNCFMLLNDLDSCGMFIISPPYHNIFEGTYPYYDTVSLAAIAGEKDYIEWKLRNDPSIMESPIRRELIGQTLLRSTQWEIFFRTNIFSSNSQSPLVPIVALDFESYADCISADFDSLTTWQCFLVRAIMFFEAYFERYGNPSAPACPGKAIEEFLRRGADPYCRILLTSKNSRKSNTISFPEARSYNTVREEDTALVNITNLQEIMDKCQQKRGLPKINWEDEVEEEYSLYEWIAVTDWPNRDTLLELLDRTSK